MKVSIVSPTFNSEKTIGSTIDSILAQDFHEIEHIIIDNCSTDRTKKIAEEKYKNAPPGRELIFVSERDEGISDAFNKGILKSSGDVIGILNSDDVYHHSKVISQVMSKFESEKADFVHGDMVFIDEEHGTNIRKPLLCSLNKAMPYNHPTFFLKKKVYQDIGVFKVDYRYAMDFELICRMYATPEHCNYKGVYLEGEPLVEMMAGGASWTNELKSIDELERSLKEHGFWNKEAEIYQNRRRFRIKLKGRLRKLKLDALVKIWRYFKWR